MKWYLTFQKIYIALASVLDKGRCHGAGINDLFYHQEMIVKWGWGVGRGQDVAGYMLIVTMLLDSSKINLVPVGCILFSVPWGGGG